jgi:hypothetical protein
MNQFVFRMTNIDVVIGGLSSPSMPNPVALKIISFLNLQRGWHYGDGEPSPHRIVSTALTWDSYLRSLGLNDIDAFSGDSGEILLSAMQGHHSIDVILEIDDTISVAYDRENLQQSSKPHISDAAAKRYVATLAREIWRSSVGYTAIDLTRGKTALPAWPLETPGTMGVYRSQSASVYIASDIPAETRYVNTQGRVTWPAVVGSFPIRPFIGDSTHQTYRRVTG